MMYFNYEPGYIEVITGCMFAGKTEELIRRLNVLSYTDASMVVYKPAIDVRYDKVNIVSHAGTSIPSVPVTSSEDIANHLSKSKHYDVVAIDEIQFFDEGIVPLIERLANDGIRVIVAGLDLDFKAEPFGPIPNILTIAEFVTKLPAICSVCGGPATRSQRLVGGQPASKTDDVVQVGASESYEARCRKCHVV